ncbi:MAG: hypothetical protein N3A02_00140 [Rectinema sp.]|nr:hypothetical protein [Rectinema sp.]
MNTARLATRTDHSKAKISDFPAAVWDKLGQSPFNNMGEPLDRLDLPETTIIIRAIATHPERVNGHWGGYLLAESPLRETIHYALSDIPNKQENIAKYAINTPSAWCLEGALLILGDPETSALHRRELTQLAKHILRTAKDSYTRCESRSMRWLHHALKQDAVPEILQRKLAESTDGYQTKALRLPNNYQGRDDLCARFGSREAALDFHQRLLPYCEHTSSQQLQQLIKLLAEEQYDPAPYEPPPLPPLPALSENQLRAACRLWSLAHNITFQERLDSLYDLARLPTHAWHSLVTNAGPRAQRMIARYAALCAKADGAHELRTQLPSLVAPLASHDPRSVDTACYPALLSHFLQTKRLIPQPWEKTLKEKDYVSSGYWPDDNSIIAGYAYCGDRSPKARYELLAFCIRKKIHPHMLRDAWERVRHREAQQQDLLAAPQALTMHISNPANEQATGETIVALEQDLKRCRSTLALLAVSAALADIPLSQRPEKPTSLLQLLAMPRRGNSYREALLKHFGKEAVCGALTMLLLSGQGDTESQHHIAQALSHISK